MLYFERSCFVYSYKRLPKESKEQADQMKYDGYISREKEVAKS